MDVILDAHTASACDVHTGLDRHDSVLGQWIRGRAREPRRLVHFETDAVTGRMPERRPEAAPLDRIARQRIGFAAGHPGADPLARASLRLLHQSVQRTL